MVLLQSAALPVLGTVLTLGLAVACTDAPNRTVEAAHRGAIRLVDQEFVFEVRHCAFEPEVPGNREPLFQLHGAGEGTTVTARILYGFESGWSAVAIRMDGAGQWTAEGLAFLSLDAESRLVSGQGTFLDDKGKAVAGSFEAECPPLSDGQENFQWPPSVERGETATSAVRLSQHPDHAPAWAAGQHSNQGREGGRR
jgi:hypothetical protein